LRFRENSALEGFARRRPVLAAAALFLVAGGCSPERQVRAEFGIGGGADDLLSQDEPMRVALGLGRALASGQRNPTPPPELCGFEGRRVFLSSYDHGRLRRVSTGKGSNLCESIEEAARGQEGQVANARLKLDVATRAEPARFTPEDLTTPWQDAGLVGFWVRPKGSEDAAFVVPSEIVERELQAYLAGRADVQALRRVLRGRLPEAQDSVPYGAPMIRFRTESWVELDGEAVRLYRGHAWSRPELTPDLLLRRIVVAADYLERVNDAEGRFEYGFDPTTGRTAASYNMVRHAGGTYGLLQAYGRTGDRRYLDASRRALDFLTGHVRDRTLDDGRVVAHVVDDRYSKLGGQGLGLLAFSTYAEVAGDLRDLPLMRRIAEHILTQIQPDGDVVHYFDWGPGGRVDDVPVLFYPGEAAVGLLGLNRIDPDPRWLEGARRILRFIMEQRDAHLGVPELQHDQWQLIALSLLYSLERDDAYRVQAMRIAEAIRMRERTGEDPSVAAGYRDYLGSFFTPPEGTHAAARMEGLVAAVEMARMAGTGEEAWLMPLLEEGIAFCLQLQYVEPRLYFVRMSERGGGAFSEGLHANFVRIDYTRHNLSALLGLERLLRAEGQRESPGR
jgi:hypothetical protein